MYDFPRHVPVSTSFISIFIFAVSFFLFALGVFVKLLKMEAGITGLGSFLAF